MLDLGCGRGPYLYFWQWFVGVTAGIELSEWACKNAFVPYVVNGDISNEEIFKGISPLNWDLITAFDVLEHLDDNQLDLTLKNMLKYGNQFLISVPVIGDPNLLNDKTHKQLKTKEEWIKLWESYGLKITEAPKDWLYHEQLFIGERI